MSPLYIKKKINLLPHQLMKCSHMIVLNLLDIKLHKTCIYYLRNISKKMNDLLAHFSMHFLHVLRKS